MDTVCTNPLIMTLDGTQLFLHVDQLYVCSPRAVPPLSTIYTTSELTPELDLVGVALSRDSPASKEVVSSTSGKSGLYLWFMRNRTCPVSSLQFCRAILTTVSVIPRGPHAVLHQRLDCTRQGRAEEDPRGLRRGRRWIRSWKYVILSVVPPF